MYEDYFKDHVDLIGYYDENNIMWCAEAPFGSGLEKGDDVTVLDGKEVVDAVVDRKICLKKTDDEYLFIASLFGGELPKVRSVVTHKFFVYSEKEQEKSNDDDGMD